MNQDWNSHWSKKNLACWIHHSIQSQTSHSFFFPLEQAKGCIYFASYHLCKIDITSFTQFSTLKKKLIWHERKRPVWELQLLSEKDEREEKKLEIILKNDWKVELCMVQRIHYGKGQFIDIYEQKCCSEVFYRCLTYLYPHQTESLFQTSINRYLNPFLKVELPLNENVFLPEITCSEQWISAK